MPEQPTIIPTPQQLAGEAALALELIGQFFATQIDAGAVTHAEIAAHVRACADRVADRLPLVSHHVTEQAMAMIERLPAGWAEGDGPDWQEPA